MPNYTSYLNLKKPLGTENYNVEDQNANMDAIAQEAESKAQQISGLSDDVEACFQSVSSGKQVVATAITGKGVPTSGNATFSQMANNIGQITTQSTLTGTAAVGDVLNGKTFYAADPNTKLTGTLALTGTALAAQVLAGNYFYNTDAKNRILGTMINRDTLTVDQGSSINGSSLLAAGWLVNNLAADPSNRLEITFPNLNTGYHGPTTKEKMHIWGVSQSLIKAGQPIGAPNSSLIGTYTSDANAVAGNLVSGKTAYVNGNKITGTLVDLNTATKAGQNGAWSYGNHTYILRVDATSFNYIFLVAILSNYNATYTFTVTGGNIYYAIADGAWQTLSPGGSFSRYTGVNVRVFNPNKVTLNCDISVTAMVYV